MRKIYVINPGAKVDLIDISRGKNIIFGYCSPNGEGKGKGDGTCSLSIISATTGNR